MRIKKGYLSFIQENEKDRRRYVCKWAEYVRMHDDKDWSRQQNVIINSALRSANMTREQFFKMKKEIHYK